MTMFILVFIIFGWLSFDGIGGLVPNKGMNLNQMPDVEIPYVTIQTIYPGAGPKEIEMQISKKIEDVVATVSMIEKIESYSLDGVSIVIIEFDLDKDVNVASQEVKSQVETILNELPDDAERPIVQKIDFKAFPIIDVILSGDLSAKELYDIADKKLKDRFSQIQGVAKVDITGGQEREIKVAIDNRIAFENSISLPQTLQMIGAQNMDIPGGYIKIADQEYTVRFEGEFPDLQAMRDMEIPTAYGVKKLDQIADVIDGGKKIRQRAVYFNVKKDYRDANVVRLGIVKSSEGNVVKVAEEIRSKLPEIESILPEGASLEVVNDESIFTRSTVDDTFSNVVLGIIFTSLVLLLFLANARSTFIVALSMPTSIISSFMLMQMFDLSLNMMTLMGLSVSVGVLVANSVVVLENIFRHKNMGKDKKEAAYVGTTEVTVAVLAATMTNLVVFLPIAAMTSMVGRFLRELALSASFATIFSLIMSFTLTPMLASLIISRKSKPGWIEAKMNAFYKKWDDVYRWLLRKVLANWGVTLAILGAVGVAFFLVLFSYGDKLGSEFMPPFDDGKIKVEVELPEGYNLDETAEVLKEVENKLKKHPEVKHLLTNLGKKSDIDLGTNMARMDVMLVDAKDRDIGLLDMISVFTRDLAEVPNARITVGQLESMGPGGNPVEFFLLGQDLDTLEVLKNRVIDEIRDVKGLINLDHSSRAGKPEISVYPKREKLAETGLTVMDLALTLRASIEGIVSTQYRDEGNEYDIAVTMTERSIDEPEKIGNITIISPMGIPYRLSQLADIEFTTGYTKVLHRDRYTAILISGGNAASVPLGDVTGEITKRLEKIEFPEGYRWTWGGSTKMMNEMFADMAFAIVLAILLTYMLLAAILESFLQPVQILATMPLALIGVIPALYYLDIALGLTSLMAVLMLIGIVVNNAILMLDYTNMLVREEGMSVKDALIQACPTKLKPIIMSSTAIVLGMLPMALGIGDAGKEMRIPMGVVSISGLLASTTLALFVIPASTYFFSALKSGVLKIFKR